MKAYLVVVFLMCSCLLFSPLILIGFLSAHLANAIVFGWAIGIKTLKWLRE